jgi:hypothetical protein
VVGMGWAKTVRMAAATISLLPRGTRAGMLRMKCNQQRCQLAPSSTALMATVGPAWASELTSSVPEHLSVPVDGHARGDAGVRRAP